MSCTYGVLAIFYPKNVRAGEYQRFGVFTAYFKEFKKKLHIFLLNLANYVFALSISLFT